MAAPRPVSSVPGTTQRVGSFLDLTDLKRAQRERDRHKRLKRLQAVATAQYDEAVSAWEAARAGAAVMTTASASAMPESADRSRATSRNAASASDMPRGRE